MDWLKYTERPFVEIHVGNTTQHDVIIASRTVLGSIQPIDRIVETDQINSVVNEAGTLSPNNENDGASSATLWHPPVAISHLGEKEQAVVKQLLYEESNAFACYNYDIGCIPNPHMTIMVKDDIPVRRSYAAIPKPLYKEVEEYIQDLPARKWIVKSKSQYATPVVCVRALQHHSINSGPPSASYSRRRYAMLGGLSLLRGCGSIPKT